MTGEDAKSEDDREGATTPAAGAAKVLYNDIEIRENFYSQAKEEVLGSHLPETQES